MIHGLALWTAHPQTKHDLSATALDVVSLVGCKDGVLNGDQLGESAERLPEHTIWLALAAGNHAQFGNYDIQEHEGWPPRTRKRSGLGQVDGTLE